MAKVTVKMFATVREAAGRDIVMLDAKDVSDVLKRLGETQGPSFRLLLGELASDPDKIVILINGRNPGHSRALTQKLSDGDEVALFPPVSGG
jgi:molybdopterin synthase sulfur carrier subunit